MSHITRASLGLLCLVAMVFFVCPLPAQACGGFFCNRQPIEQSGENIVFAVEGDGTIETHIQILYQGTAEDFAWIVPVPAVPELGVSTNALFQQVRQSTNPSFPVEYERTGRCRRTPYCSDGYEFIQTNSINADGSGPPRAYSDPDLDVILQEAVGPYDAVILAADDATALFDWLRDNGYDIPEASVPLLMEYIASGTFFVALKLQQDRGTGEIQPIVLRYAEQNPCIPIKLTSIATIPDMPVTAYILGDRRARPSNYRTTEPDLDDPGLWLEGASYFAAVSRAVDEAGGHAFVTDYAGPTPALVLALSSIEDLRSEWDPRQFLMKLQERGFNGDAQLRGILMRHLPPPEGVSPDVFYNCLARGSDSCSDRYVAYIGAHGFNASTLVDDLDTVIVVPRARSQALVERHAQITRLTTTLSAEEMTLDPIFDLDADVPEASNIHPATYLIECSPDHFRFHAPQTLILPSGRAHVLQEGIPYLGSDAAYCEDRAAGLYGPDVDAETARERALERGRPLGGGGGCSASRGRSGFGAALLVFVGLLMGRRRGR